jgi:uncharacterized protein YndB with AHSA1/START domain
METYVVKKQIHINAPQAMVWDALTNPEKTEQYFFNCRISADWEPGGNIAFDGKIFWFIPIHMQGKIDDIKPGKLLKYTLNNRGSDTKSTVTDTLTSVNGGTFLTITDDVGGGKGAEKRFKRSQKGWDKVLKGLKELVENEIAAG